MIYLKNFEALDKWSPKDTPMSIEDVQDIHDFFREWSDRYFMRDVKSDIRIRDEGAEKEDNVYNIGLNHRGECVMTIVLNRKYILTKIKMSDSISYRFLEDGNMDSEAEQLLFGKFFSKLDNQGYKISRHTSSGYTNVFIRDWIIGFKK